MIRLFFMMSLIFAFIVPQAWGAKSPYPDPNRQTMWNNITDGIHTFGQNSWQTKKTLTKLHNARTNARIHSMVMANKAKMQAWRDSQNE